MKYIKKTIKIIISILITPVIYFLLFGASIYAIYETIWEDNKPKTGPEQ